MALGSLFSLPDEVFLISAGSFGAVTWQVWDAAEPLPANMLRTGGRAERPQ